MLQDNRPFFFCESDCHNGPALFAGLWFSHFYSVLVHPNINLYVFPAYSVFIFCRPPPLSQFTTMEVVATLFISHSSPRASVCIVPCWSRSRIVRVIFQLIGPSTIVISASLICCAFFSPLAQYSHPQFPTVVFAVAMHAKSMVFIMGRGVMLWVLSPHFRQLHTGHGR